MLLKSIVWIGLWHLLMNHWLIPPVNYFNFGNRLYQQGQYPAAEAAYQQALASPELGASASYNAGNADFQQGKFDQAIRCYERALEQNPGDEDAWHNLELARRQMASPPLTALDSSAPQPRRSLAGNKSTSRPNPSASAEKRPQVVENGAMLSLQAADDLLARYREKGSMVARPAPGAGVPDAPAQGRDIFTQSPEELLETMREETRASYPFKPGASLTKPRARRDKIIW